MSSDNSETILKPKPTYIPSLLEKNIRFTRTFPHTWRCTTDEWKYHPAHKEFSMRCLFDIDKTTNNVHLRTIDSLSNQHLYDSNEDSIYKVLGRKANTLYLNNKRNGIPEKSPGDKAYKAVEYSPLYYNSNSHSREPIRRSRLKADTQKLNDIIDCVPDMFTFDNMDDYDLTANLKSEEYMNEIDNVRNLDEWKAATPLKPAFKVVNREDKGSKYRPRVNR